MSETTVAAEQAITDDNKAEAASTTTLSVSEAAAASSPSPSKRRKRLGRASRRRRKKLLEIQKAAAQALTTHSTGAAALTQTVLPIDRDRVWPAVWEHRTLSQQDEMDLISQLGYVPGNAMNVASRAGDVPCLQQHDSTKNNLPVTIRLYPIVLREEQETGKQQQQQQEQSGKQKKRFKARKRKRHDDNTTTSNEEQQQQQQQADDDDDDGANKSSSLMEPFPTLYWLTHPVLRVLISQLEVQGLGAELEKRLRKADEVGAALAQMKRAHVAYGQERYDLLTPDDMKVIESRHWQSALDASRGVAGMRYNNNACCAVKCLHAHAAHYLSQSQSESSSDNVVGKWVMEQVDRLLKERKKE